MADRRFTALIVLLSAPVFILIVVFCGQVPPRPARPTAAHPAHRGSGSRSPGRSSRSSLLLVFYVWSTRLFFDQHQSAADALEINVVAKQWMWKFQHPGGQREINELHVPVGQPVKLTMTSQDVIHSLYRAGAAAQAGRRAGPLHAAVVQGRPARHLSACAAPSSAAPTIGDGRPAHRA